MEALLTEEGGAVAMAVEVATPRDWQLILGLLEVCGAGAFPITMEELEAGRTRDKPKAPHEDDSEGMRRECMCKPLRWI